MDYERAAPPVAVDPPSREDQRDDYERRMWPFPAEMIIGMQRGEWPVHAFVNMSHALAWIEKDPIQRRLRKVSLTLVGDMTYIKPSEPRLEILP